MEFRDYQQQGYDDINTALARHNAVMYVLPCRGGKTPVLARFVQDYGAAVAIAHRAELVSQMSRTLGRYGVRHRVIGSKTTVSECIKVHMDTFGRSYVDANAHAAVASVDTIVNRDANDAWFKQVRLWVVDECFIAGTLVDGRGIETIRVGDYVTAFDDMACVFDHAKVLNLFKNPAPDVMVRLTIDGNVTYPTLGHPYYTRRGWVEAGNLTTNDEILFNELYKLQIDNTDNIGTPALSVEKNWENILFKKLWDGSSNKNLRKNLCKKISKCVMYDLRSAGCRSRLETTALQENRSRVLFKNMLRLISSNGFVENNAINEYKTRFGAHEVKQPYEVGIDSFESIKHFEGNGTQTVNARWKWKTGNVGRNTLTRMLKSFGVHTPMQGFNATAYIKPRLPKLLQNRLRKSSIENSNRSRWCKSQHIKKETAGCQKRQIFNWHRVGSIEILKSSDIGGNFDGFVYNIEVDRVHTYTANGIVVHNCHHLLAKNKWGKAVNMFPNAKGLGFTATPRRGDGLGLGSDNDGLFDTLIEGPTARELINRKFLADYRIFCPPNDLDLSRVNITATGEFSFEPLREAVHKSKITGCIVDSYLKIAPGSLGMTFCVDVDEASKTVAAYNKAGVRAELVTADTPPSVRALVQRDHQNRKILQLVNVGIFGEGVDIPNLEVVSLANPTASFAKYYQEFCRTLNPLPGKVGIVIDHVGNVMRHGLIDAPQIWTLDRREKRSKSDTTRISLIKTCPMCTQVYERVLGNVCPYCGEVAPVAGRSTPQQVDGVLHELDLDVLRKLRGEIDAAPKYPYNAQPVVKASIDKNWREKTEAQKLLREQMALWATGKTDIPLAQREFYLTFGIDVATAQTLNKTDATTLTERIRHARSN